MPGPRHDAGDEGREHDGAHPADPPEQRRDARASEGIDHLQAAALEMIEAARAFLDVAEDLVADREALGRAVGSVGALADLTGRVARPGAARDERPGGADDERDPVQHIAVS